MTQPIQPISDEDRAILVNHARTFHDGLFTSVEVLALDARLSAAEARAAERDEHCGTLAGQLIKAEDTVVRLIAERDQARAERDQANRIALDEITKTNRYFRALDLIAAPMRPDGTYNRCREACEKLAADALKEPTDEVR